VEYLTGEFRVTLDDKGRLSLPAYLRRGLEESRLYLTKGTGKCLWLYSSVEWNKLKDTIMENTDPFSKKFLNLRRQIIGPSQEVEIDKAGRIPVASSLREFACLSKDCIVMGLIDYIEIWAEDRYREYLSTADDEYAVATEELSITLKNKRGAEA